MTILEARGSNIDVTLSQTDKYNSASSEVAMLMDSAEAFILQQGPPADDLDSLQKQLSEQRVRMFLIAHFLTICYASHGPIEKVPKRWRRRCPRRMEGGRACQGTHVHPCNFQKLVDASLGLLKLNCLLRKEEYD